MTPWTSWHLQRKYLNLHRNNTFIVTHQYSAKEEGGAQRIDKLTLEGNAGLFDAAGGSE